MALIDFSIFCSFDGNDLLTSFADDKDGDSSVLDFTVHCLRYDDIVHKEIQSDIGCSSPPASM